MTERFSFKEPASEMAPVFFATSTSGKPVISPVFPCELPKIFQKTEISVAIDLGHFNGFAAGLKGYRNQGKKIRKQELFALKPLKLKGVRSGRKSELRVKIVTLYEILGGSAFYTKADRPSRVTTET